MWKTLHKIETRRATDVPASWPGAGRKARNVGFCVGFTTLRPWVIVGVIVGERSENPTRSFSDSSRITPTITRARTVDFLEEYIQNSHVPNDGCRYILARDTTPPLYGAAWGDCHPQGLHAEECEENRKQITGLTSRKR